MLNSYSLLIAYVYCRDDGSRIHMGVAHSLYCPFHCNRISVICVPGLTAALPW